MVVTTLHKLIGLSVALLGQAPGTDLLNQWTRLYTQSREDGMDAMAALQRVAQHILDSVAFAEVHPAFKIFENEAFAQRFLDSLLGETASAEMVSLVVGLLNSGTPRAEVAVRAVEFLLELNHQGSDHADHQASDHQAFGAYAMRFSNQVEVARYYTADKKWMTPNESVLAGVDGTAASVTAAKERIDDMPHPGRHFVLTTNVDQFTGTPRDDTFVATESTLNSADRLNGKDGMDTLELSSGSGNADDISIPLGAMVENIETLSVNSDGKFSGNVSKWTGLETVKLEVVKDVDLELDADAAVKVMSDSLGDAEDASEVTIENAGMVALEGVSKQATVKITGEGTESVMVEGGKSVHVNTKASPSTTVNSVTVDGVARNNGDDGKRDGTTGAGTEDKNKDKASVEVYSKALANIALHNTDAIVLVQNDAKDMTELKAMVNKFGLSASMMGKLCLQGIEDLMLQVEGDSWFDLASNEIKSIDVSGAGALTLDVNQFDNSKASTTLESLMLSGSGKFTMQDASGLSKLKTIDASDATGDIHIEKLGNGVTSYTGSSVKDRISVSAFSSKGLMANLGAGDDTFTVNNASVGKSKIDGGAGMDTLVLKQTDGAKVKGAGDAFTGFETITLDAGGGKGDYDLKGLKIDKLTLSSGVGDKNGVKFMNVTPGLDLSASSAAGKTTYAIVNYMMEPAQGQGSRFGGGSSTTTLNLHLHANGHKDDTKALAGNLKERGVVMDLTLDDDIDTLIVDSSATTANNLKAGDYYNRVVVKGEDKVEQIKITGDARIGLSNTWFFEWGQGGKAVPKNSITNAEKALTNVEYVDARENTAGVGVWFRHAASKLEIHGSPANDVLMHPNPSTDDELMGYGGHDMIAAGLGTDKITGGAGGDFLVAGKLWIGTAADNFKVRAYYYHDASPKTVLRTAGSSDYKNTFIYNAASDSTVSDYDIIAVFDGSQDKIDLSKVVDDLQGTIKNGNHGMNGASGGGDDFANTRSLNEFVTTHHKGGKGVFMTSDSTKLGDSQHSIVLVDTRENVKSKSDIQLIAWNGGYTRYLDSLSNKSVKWILVDVDGDGDFNAGTDMAIMLLDLIGTVGSDNFI